MCIACDTLICGTAGVEPHQRMHPVGVPVDSPGRFDRRTWVIDYLCRDCAATWHFHLDPDDPSAGFQRGRFAG